MIFITQFRIKTLYIIQQEYQNLITWSRESIAREERNSRYQLEEERMKRQKWISSREESWDLYPRNPCFRENKGEQSPRCSLELRRWPNGLLEAEGKRRWAWDAGICRHARQWRGGMTQASSFATAAKSRGCPSAARAGQGVLRPFTSEARKQPRDILGIYMGIDCGVQDSLS